MWKKTLIAALLSSTLLSGAACARQDEAERPPNIIIILADDLGWADISLNGADSIKTPNIDRLGNEGVQLTQFYAGSNVCTPSRAALLTGRYPIRSGMQHVVHPQSTFGLKPEEITIAELLKDEGYATGMVGKWHLGHHDEFWPTNQGFEEFYGVAYSNDMQPFDLYDGKTIIESPIDQTKLSDKYTEAVTSFIAEHREEPFFLYFAQTFPHLPLHVPEDAAGLSEAGLYGDVVEHLDEGIGAMLDALDEAGIADNTLIIFTSDNGPWFEGDSGLRGRKGGTHEGGYRVPFLARWPGHIAPGTESELMAMNIDLLPTIAHITGAKVPEDRVIDGRDILPIMEGEDKPAHDVLYFFDENDVVAARNDRFRIVLNEFYRKYYIPLEAYGASFLFDLKNDPQERFSYVREYPEQEKALHDAINQMRADIKDLVTPAPNPLTPADGEVRKGPVLHPEE